MALPAAIAGTAAAAAYLNAKYHIRHDLKRGSLANTAVKAQRFIAESEAQGRLLLYHVLEEHAQKQPNRLFLEYDGRSWTYKQFFEDLQRVGNWLLNDLDIKVGEMVAIDGPNSAQYLMLWFALEGIGAGVSFVNSNLTATALVHSVKICEARYLITERGIEHLVGPSVKELANEGVETVWYDAELFDSLNDSTLLPKERLAGLKASDVRKDVSLTSATSHIHERNNWSSERRADARGTIFEYCSKCGRVSSIDFRGQVLYLLAFVPRGRSRPMYNSHDIRRSIDAARKKVLEQTVKALTPHLQFSHRTFWPEVCESKANRLQYVGELCRYLINAPVHPMERSHCLDEAWGNGMRSDVWEQFRQRFNIPVIHELYAATDGMGATFNYNRGDFSRNAIGVRGLIWRIRNGANEVQARIDPDTENVIRGDNGYVIRAGTDEPGEVLHRIAPEMKSAAFKGYFKNEEASEKRWMTDVFEPNDLWFRSGDVMRVDADGRVFFVDRLGDTFRWKSENVSTNEVADVLGTFHQIAETNVFGIAVPRSDGRCGAAILVLQPPNTIQSLDLKALAQHVTSRLPRYAVPVFLRVAPELSYTGTFKIQKGQAKREGVDLDRIEQSGSKDAIFWLPPKSDSYVPYNKNDWEDLKSGRVKL